MYQELISDNDSDQTSFIIDIFYFKLINTFICQNCREINNYLYTVSNIEIPLKNVSIYKNGKI